MKTIDINRIYNGDCLDLLKTFPNNTFDCCITSPPYYKLRDYGSIEQVGLENTPEEYIKKLVAIFREVRRTLKDEGTLWINIADTYAKAKQNDIKSKDLIGIPWMLAFALRADGWYLRQDIIWQKPNAMPENIKDRCSKSHEYIFLLSKSRKYYFDYLAIKQPAKSEKPSLSGFVLSRMKGYNTKDKRNPKAYMKSENVSNSVVKEDTITDKTLVNKRSVWSVCTMPSKENHCAMYPENLIYDCIKAGASIDGIVLDPFMGAGTTGLVARKLGRNFVGCELNPQYTEIANKRLKDIDVLLSNVA